MSRATISNKSIGQGIYNPARFNGKRTPYWKVDVILERCIKILSQIFFSLVIIGLVYFIVTQTVRLKVSPSHKTSQEVLIDDLETVKVYGDILDDCLTTEECKEKAFIWLSSGLDKEFEAKCVQNKCLYKHKWLSSR